LLSFAEQFTKHLECKKLTLKLKYIRYIQEIKHQSKNMMKLHIFLLFTSATFKKKGDQLKFTQLRDRAFIFDQKIHIFLESLQRKVLFFRHVNSHHVRGILNTIMAIRRVLIKGNLSRFSVAMPHISSNIISTINTYCI
jgi:hypothetical protein